MRVAETWGEISLGVAPGRQAEGDEVAREGLFGTRQALVCERTRLLRSRGRIIGMITVWRARLTGVVGGNRGGGG